MGGENVGARNEHMVGMRGSMFLARCQEKPEACEQAPSEMSWSLAEVQRRHLRIHLAARSRDLTRGHA